uniref:Transmembrane 4 L six family member 1 n=1 Tax=Equus caballus TaxID=9796 RepID=F7BIS0_HORSE
MCTLSAGHGERRKQEAEPAEACPTPCPGETRRAGAWESCCRQCCCSDETENQGHVMVPALMLLRGDGDGCCAYRCGMLFPVLLATQGTAGALYCVVISSLGLLSGPFCDTGNGNYTYPFRNNTLEDSYLFNQPTWAACQEPEQIVLWNVVLFSILLGIGVVEAVLCLSQVISGLCDIFCGTCVRKGQWGRLRGQINLRYTGLKKL